MSDDDKCLASIAHQMDKLHNKLEKQKKHTLKISVTRPIIYGPPVTIDFGHTCDYDRGAWRSKVYHVVLEGRGTAHTLCGRETLSRELWVAYLQPGAEEETPIARRVCKKCAAHEDYALYLLAKT